MLTIRLQRTGRSGHSQFRVIVQDSRFSPTRGRVVSYLGSYDPHTKTTTIDSDKASRYLKNGAQPSDRVARLLQKEGIKLPNWVKLEEQQKRSTRNPDKRRSTRPADSEAPAAEPAPEPATEEAAPSQETPTELSAEETPAQDAPAETEAAPEVPAESTPPAAEASTEEPSAEETAS